jgi:hypothetical protein
MMIRFALICDSGTFLLRSFSRPSPEIEGKQDAGREDEQRKKPGREQNVDIKLESLRQEIGADRKIAAAHFFNGNDIAPKPFEEECDSG